MQVDGSGTMEEVSNAIDMYLTEYEKRVEQESAAEQPDSVLWNIHHPYCAKQWASISLMAFWEVSSWMIPFEDLNAWCKFT